MSNTGKSDSKKPLNHHRDDEIELLQQEVAKLKEILKEKEWSPNPYSDSGVAWCNYRDQED